MKDKRDSRIGETRTNHQGLTMQIIQYKNNKDIVIEFVETGEKRNTTYYNFKKGKPTANLLEHPSRTECSLKHAVIITIGILTLILTTIGGLIYWIVK